MSGDVNGAAARPAAGSHALHEALQELLSPAARSWLDEALAEVAREAAAGDGEPTGPRPRLSAWERHFATAGRRCRPARDAAPAPRPGTGHPGSPDAGPAATNRPNHDGSESGAPAHQGPGANPSRDPGASAAAQGKRAGTTGRPDGRTGEIGAPVHPRPGTKPPGDGGAAAQPAHRRVPGADEDRQRAHAAPPGAGPGSTDRPVRPAGTGESGAPDPLGEPADAVDAATAARVLLLHAAHAGATALTHVYTRGSAAERRAVLLALPYLDPPGEPHRIGADAIGLVEDALRANDTRLVAAAVGPYAAEHLAPHGWRQAVLKCLFTGVPVDAVAQLASRAAGDGELARMLTDYAAERTAAGRDVPVDLHRVLAHTGRPAGTARTARTTKES